jgi:hypothetical protein
MTDAPPARAELIARYKALLRDFIDRRPSGLRGKLALALGKHKSFVSQITNPAYSVPIPAGDLDTIFALCHLSAQEQARFLALYQAAHPQGARRAARAAGTAHELRIALPAFRNPATAREVEALILDVAARTIRLAQHGEEAGEEAPTGRKGRRG